MIEIKGTHKFELDRRSIVLLAGKSSILDPFGPTRGSGIASAVMALAKKLMRGGTKFAVTSAAATVGGSPFAGIDQGEKLFYGFGTITPAGNYAAGGDPFDFTKMAFNDGSQLPSTYGPVPGSVTIQSNSAANGHSGYLYFYRPGAVSTIQNGKFQVLQSNGTLSVDIGAGAYPAAILADSIVFSAAFVRL